MAQKPENKFIDKVNDLLPIKKRRKSAKARERYDTHLHYEKMNNPYSSGTADSWYSGPRDLWVEWKWLPRTPVRAVTDPKNLLSALQLEWVDERSAEGRNVFVIIGCPDGGVILSKGEWHNPITAQHFQTLIVSKEKIAQFIIEQANS